jgi:hypothetical protein
MKNNVNAQKIYREYTKDFVLPGATSYKPSGLKGDDSKSKLFSKRSFASLIFFKSKFL